jgi:hypothetical protein
MLIGALDVVADRDPSPLSRRTRAYLAAAHGRWRTYVWSDVTTAMAAEDGRLRVRRGDRRRGSTLALRLVQRRVVEVTGMLEALQDEWRLHQLKMGIEEIRRTRDPMDFTFPKHRWVETIDGLLAEVKPYVHFMPELATPESVSAVSARLDCLLRRPENAHLVDVKLPTYPFVADLSQYYDVVRRIDRFARAVAVLNWLHDARELPAHLHPAILPTKAVVPASLSVGAVVDYVRATDTTAPSEWTPTAYELADEPPAAVPAAALMPCPELPRPPKDRHPIRWIAIGSGVALVGLLIIRRRRRSAIFDRATGAHDPRSN